MAGNRRKSTAVHSSSLSDQLFTQALIDSFAALNQTLNLEIVLDRIMENIGKVVGHDAVDLMLLSGENVRLARSIGFSNPATENFPNRFQMKLTDVPNLLQIAESGSPMIIADTAVFPGWIDLPETRWIRSYVGAPIQSQGEMIGFLNLVSAATDAFSGDDAHRLKIFADQAAVAIRNANLFEYTRRRNEQVQLINDITTALNQPVEEPGILQTAVDRLAEALNVAYAGIALLDDAKTNLRFVADHAGDGYPSLVGLALDMEGTHSGREAEAEREVVQINDTLGQPHSGVTYRFEIESHRASLLAVPLVLHGQTIGVLGCAMLDGQAALQTEQIQLMETVANLAAVRVEQARLLSTARQRADELSALYSISLEITQKHALSGVLQDIVDSSVLLLRADGGKLFLCNDLFQEVRCVASRNIPEVQINEILQYGEGAAGKVAQSGRTLIVNNYAEWPGRSSIYEGAWKPFSLLSIPMIWHDQVTGVIQVFRGDSQVTFLQGDEALLILFANQAAIALENSHLYERLQRQAVTDELTGVYNRRGLFELGRREVERARRYRHPLAAVLFDIDHFKQVNDHFGHAVGDQLLAGVGQCCLHSVREVDLVGRYGGEEFVLLLPETDLGIAEQIAERIRSLVSQIEIPIHDGETARATISMGVTALGDADTDLDTLLVRADNAMYAAKHAGRNRIVIF